MEIPLLATKLFVPAARPGLVARLRLINRLKEAISYNLVLVSAPAGFGKTTLLSEWCRSIQPEVRTTWISLEESDSDPIRFWDYFIAALQVIQPDCGEKVLPWLHSSQPPSSEPMVTALINDLSRVQTDSIIVLDDYHLIQSQEIHNGVSYLVEHLPPKTHMVIATRVDPLLPLARLRGRGMMLEVRSDDLRFTLDEADGLLKEALGPALTTDNIAMLNERTEGWAVGLGMAILSLRGVEDVDGFVKSFTGSQRYVMDYLIEEVMVRQPQHVRDFLLNTSVLEKLTAPLCDFVTDGSGSREMLTKLESVFGGFLVTLDQTGQWYRYHHLMADFLRHQLERTCNAERIRQLHLRASEWYGAHDYPEDAIHHSLVIKDWNRATDLITRVAGMLTKRGEWNTLNGWFQAVPEDVLRVHPLAYLHYANALTTLGRLESADAALEYLEDLTNLSESLRGQLCFVKMSVAYQRGDYKQAMELAERALEQLGEEDGAMRARALHMLGLGDLPAGQLEKAESREEEAMRIAQRIGDPWVAAAAATRLGGLLVLRGRLRQAVTALQQAIADWPASAGPRAQLSAALYERNELEEADRTMRLAIENAELSGYAEGVMGGYYQLARILLANGNIAEARAEMAKQDDASRRPGVSALFQARHAAERVLFAIALGDLPAASDWGSQIEKTPVVMILLVQARLLIARGEKVTAEEQLHSLYERAMQAGARGVAIRIRVYQALGAASHDEALAFLADALRMGEHEGFVRTFVDEGRLLAPMLRKARSQGITPRYAARLLSIIEGEERRRKLMAGEVLTSPSALLSERETEVLGLVAQGLSDRQIAARLMVGLSTAKSHVHRIIEKLGVSSRTQAVAQGRSLKLI